MIDLNDEHLAMADPKEENWSTTELPGRIDLVDGENFDGAFSVYVCTFVVYVGTFLLVVSPPRIGFIPDMITSGCRGGNDCFVL